MSDTLHNALTPQEFVDGRVELHQHHRFWSRAVLLVVEGNIGVGKTTLLEKFAKESESIQRELKNPYLEFEILTEPLEAWTADEKACAGLKVTKHIFSFLHTSLFILQNYYTDPYNFAYTFQSNVQLDYFKRLVRLCSDNAIADRRQRNVITVIIMERSIHSARFVFTELAKQRGYLTDQAYKAITDLYQMTIDGYRHFAPLDGILYLQTPVEQCWNQIMRRNRPAETADDSILCPEYLADVENLYNRWLKLPSTGLSPMMGSLSIQVGRITHAQVVAPEADLEYCAYQKSVVDAAGLDPNSLYVTFRHALMRLIRFALLSRRALLMRARDRRSRERR